MQSHLGRTSTSYRLAEVRVLYAVVGPVSRKIKRYIKLMIKKKKILIIY